MSSLDSESVSCSNASDHGGGGRHRVNVYFLFTGDGRRGGCMACLLLSLQEKLLGAVYTWKVDCGVLIRREWGCC